MKSNRIVFIVAVVATILVGGGLLFLSTRRIQQPVWSFDMFTIQEDINPIIETDTFSNFYCPAFDKKIKWQSGGISHPTAAIYNDNIVLFYQADDSSENKDGKNTSRIGYTIFAKELSFKKGGVPIIYPNRDDQAKHEWMGGCEDPSVAMTSDGTYILFYTQWDRLTPRLAVAHSKDLKSWIKHGPVFEKAYNGKYYNIPSQSASILTKVSDEKQIIEKINGRYYMYWGNNYIYAATSNNLIDWTPIEDENGELKKILSPRNGKFDSKSLICGPSAVLTDRGIVLLYTGKNNEGDLADPQYSDNMLSGGQALFDASNPTKLLDQLDQPFILPDNCESGDENLTIENQSFIQSLVYFKKEWYLFYGQNNSQINVAISTPSKR